MQATAQQLQAAGFSVVEGRRTRFKLLKREQRTLLPERGPNGRRKYSVGEEFLVLWDSTSREIYTGRWLFDAAPDISLGLILLEHAVLIAQYTASVPSLAAILQTKTIEAIP